METRPFSSFLDYCCKRSADGRAITLHLWQAYLLWARKNGVAAPMKPEEFLESFHGSGLTVKGGYVHGLKIHDEVSHELEHLYSNGNGSKSQ